MHRNTEICARLYNLGCVAKALLPSVSSCQLFDKAGFDESRHGYRDTKALTVLTTQTRVLTINFKLTFER